MSEQKVSAVVPDEPNPSPQQQLIGHKVKHQLPCMQILEHLILNDSWTIQSDDSVSPDNNNESKMPSKKINVAPQLDELSQAILTGYSLKGYVRFLNIDHARAVTDRLYYETDTALRKLCEYGDGTLRFDEDAYEACIKVARLAVSRRVASNQQIQLAYDPSETTPSSAASNDGESRRLNEYVAYLSPCVPYPDLAKSLTTETSIQFVHTVAPVRSSSKTEGASSPVDARMDSAALAEALQADIDRRTGRQAVLVVAVVGSSLFGHNDPITKLIELRNTYGFWLHLVGLNAACLATSKPPEQLMRVLKAADSVTLPLGRWLGFKGLPLVTYIRSADYSPSLYQREKLDSLPWWIIMNHLHTDGIRKRIDTAFRTSGGILKHLLSHPRFILPGLGPPSDLAARLEKGTLMPPSVLTFKYVITRAATNSETSEVLEQILDDEYTDSLNVWLAQGLSSECPSLGLQLVDLSHSNLGAAIRYCPLEQQAAALVNPSDYVHHFGERLRSTVNILDATVRAKERLENVIVGKYPELQLVHLRKWAGVGGLAFLPSMFRAQASATLDSPVSQSSDETVVSGEWNAEQKRQISHFNIELVHYLRNSDGAFSVGESLEGISCVKFGMLADDRDLEDLVEMTVKSGHELEESSQYQDALAEMVRRGIEAANEGLRKENDERLMQEGVLRQVPLVGSLLNWWSPLPKDSTARGRMFDLKTGQILSTAELLSKLQSSNSVTETPSETPSLIPHLSATPSSLAPSTDSKTAEENEVSPKSVPLADEADKADTRTAH